MQLRSVGEVLILDFEPICRAVYRELKRYEPKVAHSDFKVINAVVGELLDNYLTTNMPWTKVRYMHDPERYVDSLDWLAFAHPNPTRLIEDAEDRIADLLAQHFDLPTWNILQLRLKHNIAEIVVGEDYRIEYFMKHHGDEYGFGEPRTKTW